MTTQVADERGMARTEQHLLISPCRPTSTAMRRTALWPPGWVTFEAVEFDQEQIYQQISHVKTPSTTVDA